MANAGTLEFDIRANYTSALDGLDKVGKKLEKFGRDVIELSAVVTGFSGLMVNEAAKYDRAVYDATENMKGAYSSLAVAIGQVLAPVVNETAQFMADLAATIKSLDAPTKELIASAFKLATEIGGVAAAITVVGKVSGLVSDLGPIVGALITPWGALTAAILSTVGAILYYQGAMKAMETPQYAGFHSKEAALADLKKQESLRGELGRGRSTAQKAHSLFGREEDAAEVKRYDEVIAETDARIAELNEALAQAPMTFSEKLVRNVKLGFKSIAGDFVGDIGAGIDKLKSHWKHGDLSDKPTPLTKPDAKYDVGFSTRAPPFVESASVAGSMPAFDWGSLATVEPEVNRFVDAIKDGTDRLLMSLGTFGEAVTTVKNGIMKSIKEGNSGGIWEMIVNLVLMFVQRTKGFDKWFDQLEKQMDKISDIFEQFIPAIMDATAIADPIIDFVDALLDIIPVAKILSIAFGVIGVQTKNTFGLLSLAIGELVYFIGKTLGNSKMIGAGLSLEQSGRAMLEEAKDQWSKLPDIWNRPTEAANDAANALDKFSESLTNVPTGFRVEAARFNATDMGPVHGASPVGPRPGGTPPAGVPGGWADANGLPPSPPSRTAPVEIEIEINGDMAPLINAININQRTAAARERSNRDGRYRNAYSDAGGAY